MRGRKYLHPPRGRKEQVVSVLHGKAGVATDGARSLVLLHKEGGGNRESGIKTWSSRTLSRCLDAEVGGVTEQLGTSSLIRDWVCRKGKRTVFYLVLYPMGGK